MIFLGTFPHAASTLAVLVTFERLGNEVQERLISTTPLR
jgi:hypothetical protein